MFDIIVFDSKVELSPGELARLLEWDSNDDIVSLLGHILEDEAMRGYYSAEKFIEDISRFVSDSKEEMEIDE